MKKLSVLLAAAALLSLQASPVFAQGAAVPPAQQSGNPSGLDPTASAPTEKQMLDALRGGRLVGRVTIPDQKSGVLEQPEGRDYQGFREGWLPWIGAVFILGMLALLAAFYFVRGRIRLGAGVWTGRKILRFTFVERLIHWTTATAFILLALTGLNYIFGKRLLFPLIGPDAFAAWSQWAKYIHNFVSWAFMIGVVLMIVFWIKGNIPDRTDIRWIREFGGLVGNKHPPARRFNTGQKLIFWSVAIGGLALSITGLMMLFPFTVSGINGMHIAQYIHSVVGLGLTAVLLAHIYIGTLGEEGAYDAMGSGEVDLGWATTHHSLWVEEEQAKNAKGPQLRPGAQPAE
jgi:formate dehydrogenase subunit gamma